LNIIPDDDAECTRQNQQCAFPQSVFGQFYSASGVLDKRCEGGVLKVGGGRSISSRTRRILPSYKCDRDAKISRVA
jgi:hypothetical protein